MKRQLDGAYQAGTIGIKHRCYRLSDYLKQQKRISLYYEVLGGQIEIWVDPFSNTENNKPTQPHKMRYGIEQL